MHISIPIETAILDNIIQYFFVAIYFLSLKGEIFLLK